MDLQNRTDRYTPFSPEESLDVHLVLKDLTDGRYLIRETVLSRRSGSAFDERVRMGGIEPEDTEMLESLRARSIPEISACYAETENGSLRLDAMLELLEVRLLVIRPA